jgi:hypothetical protein
MYNFYMSSSQSSMQQSPPMLTVGCCPYTVLKQDACIFMRPQSNAQCKGVHLCLSQTVAQSGQLLMAEHGANGQTGDNRGHSHAPEKCVSIYAMCDARVLSQAACGVNRAWRVHAPYPPTDVVCTRCQGCVRGEKAKGRTEAMVDVAGQSGQDGKGVEGQQTVQGT